MASSSNSSKASYQTKTLEKVVDSLDRVNSDTKKMVFDMAKGMTEQEIITQFNQTALDFFNTTISITKRMGNAREYGFEAYLIFFNQAIKADAKIPIDQFTLTVLEFAPEIYSENESTFLNMNIPDGKLTDSAYANNEFSLIRSEKFKRLWQSLKPQDKEEVKTSIILLTTYAHTFFVHTLLKKRG